MDMDNFSDENGTRRNINNTSDQNLHNNSEWSDFGDESLLQLLEEPFDISLDGSRLRTDEKYYGFDNNVGSTWIYPTNMPVRSYQFNITKVSLFRNTLVVLPTGLGKTFIAAVVMYNIYRWYPTKKVIFMAPTRPLVAQQIEGCRQIMGIPMKDTAEMTGRLNKKVRRDLWKTKRVFFVTPQVVQSDINDTEQEFPFNDIKLIVVDEAHKAKGRYAYNEVIQTISSRNLHFRILALSATPGRNIEDVAEVVRNLLISHLEVRWENSLDVSSYTHKKNVKIVVVPLDDDLKRLRDELIDIIDPYVRHLIDGGVLSGSASSISRGWLIMEQKRFREMSMLQKHSNHSAISTDFSICISLYHALELLEKHGVRVFLNFFADETNSNEQKFFVSMNPTLKKLVDNLKKQVGPNPFANGQIMTNGKIATLPENFDFGHPKFMIAKQHILDHFEKNIESKVMVFCEYRESVLLLYRLLSKNCPIIKPRIFVGQGGTGSIRAFTQKDQIQIMSDFRSGVSNTLIATSVAEEGIDVGEVDLIICFDISSKNPTRFVQRIGRTGRRRQGHVIMLATEGKEHSLIKEVLATKDKINQKIARNKEISNVLYKKSPRIVPPEFDPKCVETVMQITDDDAETKPSKKGKIKPLKTVDTKEKSKKSGKGRKAKIKELVSGTTDVRNFFKKRMEFDEEDQDVFNLSKDFSFSIPQNIKDISLENTLTQKSIRSQEMADKLDIFEVQTENNFTSDTKTLISDKFNEKEMENFRRKLATFTRNLEITSKGARVENLLDLINLKNIDNRMKKFLLEKHYDYIQEKYDAIEALEVVIDSENMEVLDKEIVTLKNLFEKIETIFGSRDEIKSYLKNRKLISSNNTTNLDNKFGDIFAGFTQRKITDNADDFINKRLAEIKENWSSDDDDDHDDKNGGIDRLCDVRQTSIVYDEIIPENEKSISLTDEDIFDDCNIVNEVDSKYISQLTQFNKGDIKNQSTPLRKQQITGKTFEKSPLVKAFNRSIEKSSNKDTKINTSIKLQSPIERKPNGIKNYFHNSSTKLSSPPKTDLVEDLLLDDDFDQILLQNSDILTQIDQKSEECLEKSNQSDLYDIEDPDMVSIEDINKIVEAKEKELSNNRSTSLVRIDNEEIHIEDFDFNEFYETFEYNDEPDKNKSSENLERKSSDIKDNKSVNLFEDTSNLQIPSVPKNKTVQINNCEIQLSKQSSEELFGSLSSSMKILPPMQEVKENISPKRKLLNDPCEKMTSPSILSGRPNLKALRNITFSGGSGGNWSRETSPILSRCNLEKKIVSNENRFSSFAFNKSKYDITFKDGHSINESVIGRKNCVQRNKRAIESSDSDEEILATCKPNTDTHYREKRPHHKKKRQKFNDFIDLEAIVSGNDSADDDEDDFVSQYQLDSIFVDENDVDEDHPSINMQAKYLQSVRSPIKALGAFKIPARRQYMDLSKIFSQPVPFEGNSIYKEDSFVVATDDDDDDETKNSDDDSSQMCPLERAEAILKARRKEKRKLKDCNNEQNNNNKFNKRLVNRGISSDEER